MMTSGMSAQADFGDALSGADGTADPFVAAPPPAVFPDPLAETRAGTFTGPERMVPPDPAQRVSAEPPQITEEARRLAERQLATRQSRQPAQQPRKSRKAESSAARKAPPPDPRTVAYPGATTADSGPVVQRNQQTDPASSMFDPAANRRQLMERIRAATGPERKRLIQQMLAQSRAERVSIRTGNAEPKAGGKSDNKGMGWGVAVVVVIFLFVSGAAQELIEQLTALFSGGN